MGDDSIVTLKYLPQCVLVKLSRTCATRLKGLDKEVIPIFPAKSSMQIVLEKKAKTVDTQGISWGAEEAAESGSEGRGLHNRESSKRALVC